MRHFDYTLSTFHKVILISLATQWGFSNQEIQEVLSGNNKEVEKRHKYYVDYNESFL